MTSGSIIIGHDSSSETSVFVIYILRFQKTPPTAKKRENKKHCPKYYPKPSSLETADVWGKWKETAFVRHMEMALRDSR